MTAKLIDGKQVAAAIKLEMKAEIEQLTKSGMRSPGLAVVLVGENPASEIYVNKKRQACQQVGIRSFSHNLSAQTTQQQLLDLIAELNSNPEVDGIVVQLPLPDQIDENIIVEAIVPHKDVDGFHPYTLGLLTQRRPLLRPCTPYGIMTLLDHYKIPVKGADAVVVGASNNVGRPMSLELLLAGATVTICHRFTHDLKKHVADAEILVVATGKRDVIKSEWIKAGATVIDVGIHRLESGKLCGDVDFETAKQRAGWITPVPGGVGPMTVVTLLRNTLYAAKQHAAAKLK